MAAICDRAVIFLGFLILESKLIISIEDITYPILKPARAKALEKVLQIKILLYFLTKSLQVIPVNSQ